jgi:uncharacterized protein
MKLLICCVMMLSAQTVWAANASVTLLTGPETGTYYAFGKNIADVAAKAGQTVKVVSSNGSIDNIRQIVESRGYIGLGIVQSDILGFLKRSTNRKTQAVAERLTMVFPFYDEEVHVLARKTIKGLKDLNGKRVVVGEEGSGNMLTAMNIFALSEVKPAELLHMPPAEGVVAVLSGDADAMVFVGGKPVPLFANLADLKQAKGGKNAHLLDDIHLIPLDDQRVYAEYPPTRINKGDYPFVKETILTAKVTAVLVGYSMDAKRQSALCKPLQAVSGAIANALDGMQETGHLKWKEVNLYEDVTLWNRNTCVWDGGNFIPHIRTASPPMNGKNADLTKDLLDVVKRGSDKK